MPRQRAVSRGLAADRDGIAADAREWRAGRIVGSRARSREWKIMWGERIARPCPDPRRGEYYARFLRRCEVIATAPNRESASRRTKCMNFQAPHWAPNPLEE